nr:zinc ribbon domain-containing protein [Chloroflexaceae bacterium]
MRCPACAADIPDDAVFCTECGTRLPEANIGPTQRLPERAQTCPRCDSLNPPGAAFCATCGYALSGAGLRPLAEPATPTIALPPPAQLPVPAPLPPPTMPDTDRLSKKATRRARRANWNALSGGVFFIGLAFLFLTGTFWPGILILIGVAG